MEVGFGPLIMCAAYYKIPLADEKYALCMITSLGRRLLNFCLSGDYLMERKNECFLDLCVYYFTKLNNTWMTIEVPYQGSTVIFVALFHFLLVKNLQNIKFPPVQPSPSFPKCRKINFLLNYKHF